MLSPRMWAHIDARVGIGALTGCILAAVLGMATVAWYAWGGHISDEEVEEQVRRQQAAKSARPGFISRFRAKN